MVLQLWGSVLSIFILFVLWNLGAFCRDHLGTLDSITLQVEGIETQRFYSKVSHSEIKRLRFMYFIRHHHAWSKTTDLRGLSDLPFRCLLWFLLGAFWCPWGAPPRARRVSLWTPCKVTRLRSLFGSFLGALEIPCSSLGLPFGIILEYFVYAFGVYVDLFVFWADSWLAWAVFFRPRIPFLSFCCQRRCVCGLGSYRPQYYIYIYIYIFFFM